MATGHRKQKLRRIRNTNGKEGGMAKARERRSKIAKKRREEAPSNPAPSNSGKYQPLGN